MAATNSHDSAFPETKDSEFFTINGVYILVKINTVKRVYYKP